MILFHMQSQILLNKCIKLLNNIKNKKLSSPFYKMTKMSKIKHIVDMMTNPPIFKQNL